jgi:hypothetical protein
LTSPDPKHQSKQLGKELKKLVRDRHATPDQWRLALGRDLGDAPDRRAHKAQFEAAVRLESASLAEHERWMKSLLEVLHRSPDRLAPPVAKLCRAAIIKYLNEMMAYLENLLGRHDAYVKSILQSGYKLKGSATSRLGTSLEDAGKRLTEVRRFRVEFQTQGLFMV